jgi:hypothetical protein
MNAPSLAKVLMLFGAILALYKLKFPLWAAIFAASALTGLWFGAGAAGTAKHMLLSIASTDTLCLCLIVVGLLGLSHLLNDTGALARLVDGLTAALGGTARSAAALPALIGLLPMPGGAVFSAPLVRAACEGGLQSPEQKSAVNYWFRHIWEYWWPLYPGIILATILFGISAWKVMLLHLPLTAAAVVSGWIFIMRPAFKVKPGESSGACAPPEARSRRDAMRTAVRESVPIIVMIATTYTLGPALSASGVNGSAARYIPVIAGAGAAIAWLAVAQRAGARRVAAALFGRAQIPMILLVAAIMVFQGTLIRVGAFERIQSDLETYRLPALVIIAALPFISALVMGLAVGFVGASFPIIISILPAGVIDSTDRFAYFTLAYVMGYAGMMLSPVHLCLIVTKDYFKADFFKIYKQIAVPCATTLLAGIALAALYKFIF